MHVDPHLGRDVRCTAVTAMSARSAQRLPRPCDGAHRSLARILRLLHSVNVRLSLFLFETLPGASDQDALRCAAEEAVDDCGITFELDDGRIGALVYGWRPPGADDRCIESRTLERLTWALGGPDVLSERIEVRAIHRRSSELSCPSDLAHLLSLAHPLGAAATGTA